MAESYGFVRAIWSTPLKAIRIIIQIVGLTEDNKNGIGEIISPFYFFYGKRSTKMVSFRSKYLKFI